MFLSLLRLIVTIVVLVVTVTLNLAKAIVEIVFDLGSKAKSEAPGVRDVLVAHASTTASRAPKIVGKVDVAARKTLKLARKAA